MALIGQHLPQIINICWIEYMLLLKLRGRKINHLHPSLRFLRGYVFHQMCQNIKHIINWHISNISEPSVVLYQTHASCCFLKINSKLHLFYSQVIELILFLWQWWVNKDWRNSVRGSGWYCYCIILQYFYTIYLEILQYFYTIYLETK
jgi:hypothetical protein